MSGSQDGTISTPPSLDERYDVVAELVAREDAKTYIARRREDGAEVLVAVFQQPKGSETDALSLFAADAQVLRATSHRALLPVLDAHWVGNDQFAIASQRIVAPTLAELLERGEKFSNLRIAAILSEVNGLLEWAREQKVVHRAVSADSVFLEPGSDRVYASFGVRPIARAQFPDASDDVRTIAALARPMLAKAGDPKAPAHVPLAELRPDLPYRLIEATEALSDPASDSTEVTDVRSYIAGIAMADAILKGEVEAAHMEATIVEEQRVEREQWNAEREAHELRVAELEQKLRDEHAAMERTIAEERQKLATERETLLAQLAADREEEARKLAAEREQLLAQVAAERAEMERELAAERDTLSEEQTHAAAALAAEREELIHQVATERAEMDRRITSEREALAADRGKSEQALAAERETLLQQVASERAEMEHTYAAQQAEISALRASTEQEVAAQRAALEQEIAAAREQFDQELTSLHAQLDRELQEREERFEAEIAARRLAAAPPVAEAVAGPVAGTVAGVAADSAAVGHPIDDSQDAEALRAAADERRIRLERAAAAEAAEVERVGREVRERHEREVRRDEPTTVAAAAQDAHAHRQHGKHRRKGKQHSRDRDVTPAAVPVADAPDRTAQSSHGTRRPLLNPEFDPALHPVADGELDRESTSDRVRWALPIAGIALLGIIVSSALGVGASHRHEMSLRRSVVDSAAGTIAPRQGTDQQPATVAPAPSSRRQDSTLRADSIARLRREGRTFQPAPRHTSNESGGVTPVFTPERQAAGDRPTEDRTLATQSRATDSVAPRVDSTGPPAEAAPQGPVPSVTLPASANPVPPPATVPAPTTTPSRPDSGAPKPPPPSR